MLVSHWGIGDKKACLENYSVNRRWKIIYGENTFYAASWLQRGMHLIKFSGLKQFHMDVCYNFKGEKKCNGVKKEFTKTLQQTWY